jgi:hypothetical protein
MQMFAKYLYRLQEAAPILHLRYDLFSFFLEYLRRRTLKFKKIKCYFLKFGNADSITIRT